MQTGDEGGAGLKPQKPLRLNREAVLRRVGRRARGENGGTLVETAFCLLLLMTFIIGIVEVSWALYSYHYIADAAREGTRYAIVRGADWTNPCDASGSSGGSGYASSGCQASVADVQNYVATLGFGAIGITTSNASNYVCVEYLTGPPSSTLPTSCTNSTGSTLANAPGDVVEVQISYPFKFGVPGLPGYTYNLTTISQMVIAE